MHTHPLTHSVASSERQRCADQQLMFLELPLRQVDPQVCNKVFPKENDAVQNVRR